MSVYLTEGFSNKMMKELLIVLSVSVRLSVFVFTSSDSETAGAVKPFFCFFTVYVFFTLIVKHYEWRQRAYLSM